MAFWAVMMHDVTQQGNDDSAAGETFDDAMAHHCRFFELWINEAVLSMAVLHRQISAERHSKTCVFALGPRDEFGVPSWHTRRSQSPPWGVLLSF